MAENKPANLAEGLILFQNSVSTIESNRSGQYGKFADLPHILSVIRPALQKAGLAVSQVASNVNGEPGLKTVLTHDSGEKLEDITPLCINKEPMVTKQGKVIPPNPMMEWGKSMTYTRRYALQSILGICMGLEDNEPEENDPVDPAPTVTQTQQSKPAAKAQAKPDLGQKIAPGMAADWVNFIKAQPKEWTQPMLKAFVLEFKTGDKKVSECITHDIHTVWLSTYVNNHPAPNQAEAAAK